MSDAGRSWRDAPHGRRAGASAGWDPTLEVEIEAELAELELAQVLLELATKLMEHLGVIQGASRVHDRLHIVELEPCALSQVPVALEP